MIHVRDLVKTYILGNVQVPALRGVSLSVQKGEFVAVMGKSGSGKSTLLRQLGLLDRPSGGEISIDDMDVLKLSEAARARYRLHKLGYVFQEYALMPELTALENVFLPAMMSGLPRQKYEARARDLLERVGLADRLHHLPKELSGGEQQRVTIARALVNRPQILFADEPCANLDSASTQTVFEVLRELNRDTELRQTIVLVTHDADDERWVNRVVHLADGKIEG